MKECEKEIINNKIIIHNARMDFRVDKDMKDTFKKEAQKRGISMTDLLQEALNNLFITEICPKKEKVSNMIEHQAKWDKYIKAIEDGKPKEELLAMAKDIWEGEWKLWRV